jgi:hypothetical protein
METLIRELEALRSAPEVTHQQLVGAVLAAAARIDHALDERMVGMQALAMAVAMQPVIDAKRLHDDFVRILESQLGELGTVPADLRDMGSALRVAAADRR